MPKGNKGRGPTPSLHRCTGRGHGAVASAPTIARCASAEPSAAGIDWSAWTPDSVLSIAGTATDDRTSQCARAEPNRMQGPLALKFTVPRPPTAPQSVSPVCSRTSEARAA